MRRALLGQKDAIEKKREDDEMEGNRAERDACDNTQSIVVSVVVASCIFRHVSLTITMYA